MKYAVMSKGGELKGTNYAISDQFPAEIMEDAGFFIRSWQRRGKETKGLAFLLINCTSMGSYTGIIASHTGWTHTLQAPKQKTPACFPSC